MTKHQIQDAANLDRLGKLRANGHAFELNSFRIGKHFAIGLRIWHRNDTERLVTYPGALQGKFISRPYAEAYIRQMEAA